MKKRSLITLIISIVLIVLAIVLACVSVSRIINWVFYDSQVPSAYIQGPYGNYYFSHSTYRFYSPYHHETLFFSSAILCIFAAASFVLGLVLLVLSIIFIADDKKGKRVESNRVNVFGDTLAQEKEKKYDFPEPRNKKEEVVEDAKEEKVEDNDEKNTSNEDKVID